MRPIRGGQERDNPPRRPLKVVIVMNLAERLGGAENALWTFLRHVNRRHIQPVVVFLGHGPFVGEVRSIGIRAHVLPASRLRQVHRVPTVIARLGGILAREQPDAVVSWLTKAQLYGGTAAGLRGLGMRSSWWQWDLMSHPLVDRLATVLPGRELAVCATAIARDQERLWPHRRARVILPGIDPPDRLSSPAAACRRRALGIPEHRRVVGIVGRLVPWKGHHHFVEALCILRSRGEDVHGLIVGGTAHGLDAAYEPSLHRLVAELGLADAITFTGQTSQATEHMQLMEVCVNASAAEPFGIVILEALSLGVPVVAVDSAGPREIIDHERTGLLVASPEPVRLADAIGRLLSDRALRRRITYEGEQVFRSRFTAQRMTGDIEDWLTDIAGASAARAQGEK